MFLLLCKPSPTKKLAIFHCSQLGLGFDKPLFGLGLGCSGTCKDKPSDDTESHIRKWRDSVNAVEIEDIDGDCLGVAYEVGLYSFTNHGSHLFIAATISSEIMIDS